MTAGVIDLCGAWGGRLFQKTRWNQRGFFENQAVRNDIIKPYLRTLQCDPMGQNPLPDPARMPKLPGLRERVHAMVREQGYHVGPWYIKEPKIALIWPVWRDAFPGAYWILVRRRTEDIVNSCLRTGFMRAFHGNAGWEWWVNKHLQRFDEIRDAGCNVREVWPTRMVEGDFSEIRAVVSELGLQWNEDDVLDFISPALWSANGGG